MVSFSNQSFLSNWDLEVSLKTSCRINGLISLPNVFILHLTVWWGTKPGRKAALQKKKQVAEITPYPPKTTPNKPTHRNQLTCTPKCQEKLHLPNTLKITATAPWLLYYPAPNNFMLLIYFIGKKSHSESWQYLKWNKVKNSPSYNTGSCSRSK